MLIQLFYILDLYRCSPLRRFFAGYKTVVFGCQHLIDRHQANLNVYSIEISS